MERLPLELHEHIIRDIQDSPTQDLYNIFLLAFTNHYFYKIVMPLVDPRLGAILRSAVSPPWARFQSFYGHPPPIAARLILQDLDDYLKSFEGQSLGFQRWITRKTAPIKPYLVFVSHAGPTTHTFWDLFERVDAALEYGRKRGIDVGTMFKKGLDYSEEANWQVLPTFVSCLELRVRSDCIRLKYDEARNAIVVLKTGNTYCMLDLGEQGDGKLQCRACMIFYKA